MGVNLIMPQLGRVYLSQICFTAEMNITKNRPCSNEEDLILSLHNFHGKKLVQKLLNVQPNLENSLFEPSKIL